MIRAKLRTNRKWDGIQVMWFFMYHVPRYTGMRSARRRSSLYVTFGYIGALLGVYRLRVQVLDCDHRWMFSHYRYEKRKSVWTQWLPRPVMRFPWVIPQFLLRRRGLLFSLALTNSSITAQVGRVYSVKRFRCKKLIRRRFQYIGDMVGHLHQVGAAWLELHRVFP